MSLRREVSISLPRPSVSTLELREGSKVEVSDFKDALMASKGDTILVVPGWFIILTNMPWQKFIEGFKALNGKAQKIAGIKFAVDVIKVNAERKYALARLSEGTVEAEFTRTEEAEESAESSGEVKVVDGVEFRAVRVAKRRYHAKGRVTLKFASGSWEIREEVLERRELSTGTDEAVEWRIVDPSTRLSRILRRYMEASSNPSRRFYGGAYVFTDQGAAYISAITSGGVDAKVSSIGLPSEEKLLACSRFYSIVMPRVVAREDVDSREIRYAEFDVYHGGRKWRLVLNTADPDTLWFRMLRRRNISSYAKRILPRGYEWAGSLCKELGVDPWRLLYALRDEPNGNLATRFLQRFNEFVDEVYNRIQSLHSKPRDTDGLEGFFEAIYARTPRRKLKVVKEWVELYEKVKHLAPKTTLYIVFYGQKIYRRRLPNFAGFRVDSDGGISVLSSRVVPVSGISFRGGDFERLYREAINLDNLVFYQLATMGEKLAILKEWVEEVRARLRSLGVEPATASFKEVYEKVKELSMNEDLTDNGVYLAFQFIEKLRSKAEYAVIKRVEELAKILVGLVKTGRYPEDYEKFAEAGFLEPMRWVVKYAIKSRGYSIRKGVLILGDPSEVKRRVKEVIQRIRGRLLALAEAVEAEGLPEEYKPAKLEAEVGERLEALARIL